ncbi:MAG: helix-turn-helix transcriptional regulator [Oscillospiraceae bacterium]|nr:helix-turn-helix transcriptional regulator [Oscillospiraceae bacterium]
MLRALRKERGLSMKQLGARMGLAESTISQYETGKREPDYETLLRLCDYFGVTADYLLKGAGPSSSPAGDGLTFDDFTYALHKESQDLTQENKQKLLEMARLFKLSQQQDKK